MHIIPLTSVTIPEYRMRRFFDPIAMDELEKDILANGLYNPIVVRTNPDVPDTYLLVQGERRLRALASIIQNKKGVIRYSTNILPEGHIPCNFLGELEPLKALELELAENLIRVNLSWQETVDAQAKLHALRTNERAAVGETQRPADTAREIYGAHITSASPETNEIRMALTLAPHMNDADVRNAKNQKEALKVVEKKQRALLEAALVEKLGAEFSVRSPHTLHLGDAFELFSTIPDGTIDVILTDPPYGMDADKMTPQSSSNTNVKHEYADDYDFGLACATLLAKEGFRVTKSLAHCYMFCRIDLWTTWRDIFRAHGWYVWPVPIIWYKPNAGNLMGRANGPRHCYDALLYAIKNNRPTKVVGIDVLAFQTPKGALHAAEKPVALYAQLLEWSTSPGDVVLDPFCGSGTIFPAATERAVSAIGFELNQKAYVTAELRRLGQHPKEE